MLCQFAVLQQEGVSDILGTFVGNNWEVILLSFFSLGVLPPSPHFTCEKTESLRVGTCLIVKLGT